MAYIRTKKGKTYSIDVSTAIAINTVWRNPATKRKDTFELDKYSETIEYGSIEVINTKDQQNIRWLEKREMTIREWNEDFLKIKNSTPEQKFRFDWNRIKQIFKLIGIRPEENLEKFTEFKRSCIVFFAENSERTKVDRSIWGLYGVNQDGTKQEGYKLGDFRRSFFLFLTEVAELKDKVWN